MTRSLAALFAVVLAGAAPAGARGDDPRNIPLVDQSGATFRLIDFRGAPSIVTFVASRCTDACPISNAVFSKTAAAFRKDHIRARFITVTLDPKYDTPFVMSGIARGYKADPHDWIFASGTVADVHRLMTSLGVTATTDGRAGYPDEHTSFIYILDKNVRLSNQMLLSTNVTAQLEQMLGKQKQT